MPTLSGASVLESTLNKTLACRVNSIQLIRKAICKGKLTATEYTLYHLSVHSVAKSLSDT